MTRRRTLQSVLHILGAGLAKGPGTARGISQMFMNFNSSVEIYASSAEAIGKRSEASGAAKPGIKAGHLPGLLLFRPTKQRKSLTDGPKAPKGAAIRS